MSRRQLLIDQGNTRLKWIWATDGVIDEASAGHGDLPSFIEFVSSSDLQAPDTVRISGVTGLEAKQAVARHCESHWGLRAHLLESEAEQSGIRNAYANPSALGVDRWLALIGAAGYHGLPVVVWDLGTASTLDAVDETGQHLGGLIYPGPATMLRSLKRDTRLPVPDKFAVAADERVAGAGRDTASCIVHGVLTAQVGVLERFMEWSRAQMKTPPRLVVSGGAAEEILPFLECDYSHDPWLVFRGMLSGGDY
jgi:type III pantothenate kinase